MSQAIMDPIMLVQVLEQGRRNDTIVNLGNSSSEVVLTDERIKSIEAARLIESQLRAYFPYDNHSIARDWNNLHAAAYNFVNLYLLDDQDKRIDQINEIFRFLAITEDKNITEGLKDRSTSNKHDYRKSFLELQDQIKQEYDNLTRSVLTNRIPEYA